MTVQLIWEHAMCALLGFSHAGTELWCRQNTLFVRNMSVLRAF